MKGKENILILTASNPYYQSGIIALDLFNALKSDDAYCVHILTKEWVGEKQGIYSVETVFTKYVKKIVNWLKRFFGVKSRSSISVDMSYSSHEFNDTLTYYTSQKLLTRARMVPNRIIVLFMQGFLSYKNLYEIAKETGATVYIFPMDMAPFTGGCHWAWECDGYKKSCEVCPAILSGKDKDASRVNLEFKQKYLSKTRVELFAANSQLADQIKASKIFHGKRAHSSIFALPDTEIFYPVEQKIACSKLGIDHNRTIFFFGANSLTSKSKGVSILLDALQIVKKELLSKNITVTEPFFLIAGQAWANVMSDFPFENKYLGYLTDFNELNLAYNAANYYISPSIQDAGPLMLLQALMCETPVISFNIGFAQDFVIDGYNGFKSDEHSARSLAQCIMKALLLSNNEYNKICLNNTDVVTKMKHTKLITKLNKIFTD